MEIFTLENELQERLEIAAFSNYIFTGIKESVGNEIITTKQSNSDGERFNSSNLTRREITIKGCIINNGAGEELKQHLIRTLNPKLRAVLSCERIYKKEIAVELLSLPVVKENRGTIDFEIDFVAPDPYWKGEMRTETLAQLEKKFTFPLIIPKNKGVIFGIQKSIYDAEIENVGDVETGFRVEFIAKGEVQNVEFNNKATKKKIKTKVTMQKGDKLEIINYINRKMILFNEKKAFKLLDIKESDFFNLQVGKNLVGYNADKNALNLEVKLHYSPLYLGR